MFDYRNTIETYLTVPSTDTVYDAKLGKLDRIYYERYQSSEHKVSHQSGGTYTAYKSMFTLEFNWGLGITLNFPVEDHAMVGEFINDVMLCAGVSKSSDVANSQLYILFQNDMRRNIPLGLASLNGTEVLIFDEYFPKD